MAKENGLNMVDMHNIDPKTILKFNKKCAKIMTNLYSKPDTND